MSDRTYKHLHHHTARSDLVQRLRERPLLYDEIHEGGIPEASSGKGLRDMLHRIRVPVSKNGYQSRNTRPETNSPSVYYLYGDERRAIRLFIEENEAYVASCITDINNPMRENWDDALYELLLEEWDFRTAERSKRGDE